MERKLRYAVFNTNMGWVGILGSIHGIRRTTLPQPSAPEARWLLGYTVNHATRSHVPFEGLMERLGTYLNGGKIAFTDELDLSEATPFQHRVWDATKFIPYGETRSYAWVAKQIENPRAARAIGQALAVNPLPIIIPCHRVLASNGHLGGFSGGVEMKRRLLNLEVSAATS